MINLIPPQAKKTVSTEYYMRVLVVGLFVVLSATVILLVLSLPVLVLIRSQLHVYQATYTAAEAQTTVYLESTAAVEEANTVATELSRQLALPLMLPYFDRVKKLAGETISVDSINLARTPSGHIETFTVTGTALTRSDLATFRDRVETDPTFSAAELPLSNLAKDKNIPFIITITVAPVAPA